MILINLGVTQLNWIESVFILYHVRESIFVEHAARLDRIGSDWIGLDWIGLGKMGSQSKWPFGMQQDNETQLCLSAR